MQINLTNRWLSKNLQELRFNKIWCFPSALCKTKIKSIRKDSTILDVVNHIHMEEAYGQFRNHIQKYNLMKEQSLKLARKGLNWRSRLKILQYPRYQMSLRLTISYYNKSILRYKLVLGGFDFEHVFDNCTTEQTLKMEINS